MKMINKAITLGLGLVMMGSATFAQSLADAKKAIDAEQYQKASSMLKTLTANQSKPENFFFLGDLYLKLEEVDSAKATFAKGIAVDAKDPFNYIGMGHVELLNNNPAAAKINFDKAVDLEKKDYKVYMYIGRAYFEQEKPDFAASLPYLQKADDLDSKDVDAEVFIALGDYWALQKKNSEALGPYLRADGINPAMLRSNVQIGRMYTRAYNFPDAEAKLKEVLAVDANYGPAYREYSELQMEWSRSDIKNSATLVASSLENYRKYLSLTDKSFDSRLRYAQFLVYGKDWKTLEEVAAGLAADNPNPSKSLLISRLRGYSAFENSNYPQSLQFMKEVFEKGKADPNKIQPSDYAYLGKAQDKSNMDSLAVISLKKAVELDSTNTDALVDVAKKYATAKNYGAAADLFEIAIKANPKSPLTLTNYYYLGQYNFYDWYYQNRDNKNPSKDILVQADSAYAYVNRIQPEFEAAYIARANVARAMDDPKAPVGLAKPFYEQYIQLVTVTKPEKATEATTIKGLIDAYGYLGYLEIDKDKEKAIEYFNKVLVLNPTSQSAIDNLKYLTTPPAPVKKAPIKK